MDEPPPPDSEPRAPERPLRPRWRSGRRLLVAVAIVGALHFGIYLSLRAEHVLFRTGWVRHRSYRDAASEPWGWRDVDVATHRRIAAERPLLAGSLDWAFVVERHAEVLFREVFEDCCNFPDERRACDDRPVRFWKWPPHHSGHDE